MKSLDVQKVTFGAITMDIIKALDKPKEWPSIVSHIFPLLSLADGMDEWFILFEPNGCNKGAYEIAKSVTFDIRVNSYVAQSYPRWMKAFLRRKVLLMLLGPKFHYIIRFKSFELLSLGVFIIIVFLILLR